MNPFTLKVKYQLFKANNRYSYPFLFFMVGLVKNVTQLSVLALGTWLLYSNITKDNSVAKIDTLVTTAPESKRIEVPASLKMVNDGESLLNRKALVSIPVQNWKWVFEQQEAKFTIQFASSSDRRYIDQLANEFPTSNIIGIYPFKRDRSGRLVYGFATGTYDSLASAQQALQQIPETALTEGAWIRKVGKLQNQVAKTLEQQRP